MTLHPDEISIDLPLVRALVDRVLPELADRPLRALETSGSSNALFRLGEDLLVRLPRQPGGSATILKEHRWLPYLASALPVTVPSVVAVGRPGAGYPECWSVTRWIEGEIPEVAPGPAAPAAGLAADLANLVDALGSLAVPSHAHTDPALPSYRAGPLGTMDAAFRGHLEECRTLRGLDLDLAACLRVWEHAVKSVESGDEAPASRWVHADLLAENLLVRDGRLVAVLDFGGLGLGDPTVDLVAGWDALDSRAREAFRSASGVDDQTWLRGRAWALAIAVMTFPYYWDTMPRRCGSRLVLARAVLADAASG